MERRPRDVTRDCKDHIFSYTRRSLAGTDRQDTDVFCVLFFLLFRLLLLLFFFFFFVFPLSYPSTQAEPRRSLSSIFRFLAFFSFLKSYQAGHRCFVPLPLISIELFHVIIIIIIIINNNNNNNNFVFFFFFFSSSSSSSFFVFFRELSFN